MAEPSDPLVDALQRIRAERDERAEQHATVRSTAEYQEVVRSLDTSLHMFLNTLKVSMFAATRHAFLANNSLFLRVLDEFGAAAIAASFSMREGLINSAMRELRFMLELAVHALFVDQRVGKLTFDKRLIYFEQNPKIKRSSADNIRELSLEMLKDQRDVFCKYVVNAWAEATKYVHPTPEQIVESLARRDKGAAIGFETADELRRGFEELFRTEAIVLVLLFHALGPSFTGDLLVDNLDERDEWPFHGNVFVAAVDEYFDYKFERQGDLSSIVERRRRRLEAQYYRA
jgi:hypothetical protein